MWCTITYHVFRTREQRNQGRALCVHEAEIFEANGFKTGSIVFVKTLARNPSLPHWQIRM